MFQQHTEAQVAKRGATQVASAPWQRCGDTGPHLSVLRTNVHRSERTCKDARVIHENFVNGQSQQATAADENDPR